MKKILKLTLFLSIVCGVCSIVLFYTNHITAPAIAKYQQKTIAKMLNEMVGDVDKFNTIEVDSKTLKKVYEVVQDGKVTKRVLQVETIGFQSELKILVAIDNKNNYTGFKVVEQAETPGYGTKIETDKVWQKQFTRKSINDDLDTIAGSTVTTEALTKAIMQSIEIYKSLNKEVS